MFYDEEREVLPRDYFLTDYESDLLTLSLEELVRKNPDKTADDLKTDLAQVMASQAVFEANNRQ